MNEPDIVEVEPGVYSVIAGLECWEVRVAGNEYTIGEHRFLFEIDDPRRWKRSKHAADAHGRVSITAAMPGKIVRVLVAMGDEVVAGQGIMVVEAMKMQNEMKAPRAGRVTAIEVKENDSVNAGAILAAIESGEPMPDFDVVGVGLNATDTVLIVPRFPAYGGKAPFTREFYSVGGQVATAVVTCARLGLRAKYIGTVGDDERGRIQMESLRASGIDVEHVQRRTDCPNQSAYIVVDESTGERTILWNRPDCLTLSPEQITPDQIAGARLLHIDGHDTPAVERAAGIARSENIPVTADVDTIYAGFDRVLPLVDYLVASAEFPALWTGIEDPLAALVAIQRTAGMRVAAMTLGSHGALAYTQSRFHYSPAFAVNCIDTTGAGDVFHGAFCYAVLQQMPIADALEFSNAMAALNCTAPGARGRIGGGEEVRQFMQSGVTRREHPAIALRVKAG